MYNGITEEKLEKLGIYDLRRVARYCGVSSPTSKRRDVLITEILKIQSGELKPVFNNKIGRPVKTIGEEGDLQTNLIINGDQELEAYVKPQLQDDSYLVLDQNYIEGEMPLSTNIIEFKGIISKTKQNNYYVISQLKLKENKIVIVDETTMNKYNLILGDLIHGVAYLYVNKGYARVKEISEINDAPTSENKYNLDFVPVIPSIVLDAPDFKMGNSKVHICQNLDDQIKYIQQKSKEYMKKGCKCVVVALESRFETKLKLDMIEGLTQIISYMDDTSQFSVERMKDALNYTNSLFYHGKNVVMFVLNIINQLSIFDTYFVDRPVMFSDKTNLSVRKILANSKASTEGSISTICLLSQNDVELKPEVVQMLQRYCKD